MRVGIVLFESLTRKRALIYGATCLSPVVNGAGRLKKHGKIFDRIPAHTHTRKTKETAKKNRRNSLARRRHCPAERFLRYRRFSPCPVRCVYFKYSFCFSRFFFSLESFEFCRVHTIYNLGYQLLWGASPFPSVPSRTRRSTAFFFPSVVVKFYRARVKASGRLIRSSRAQSSRIIILYYIIILRNLTRRRRRWRQQYSSEGKKKTKVWAKSIEGR